MAASAPCAVSGFASTPADEAKSRVSLFEHVTEEQGYWGERGMVETRL
jgi:hypothetical protein